MALEIIEKNYSAKTIYICGINVRGKKTAQLLIDQLNKIDHSKHIKSMRIYLDLDNLLESKIEMEEATSKLRNQVVVVVDDVGNTGKTLQYAVRPLLAFHPKKVQVAVLVDRMHKAFPVCADFVGVSLSTTIKEHIEVEFKRSGRVSVFLT